MAKSTNNDGFEDYANKLKKVKLSPDRMNLKPDPSHWTLEEKLTHALADGAKALEAEEKAKGSVKPPIKPTKSDSVKLENKLGEMSKNAYVRAREEVLKKMKPETRTIIEKMERNELERDNRWDTFCKAVTIKGDQISNGNN